MKIGDALTLALRIWVGGYYTFYGLNGLFGWRPIPRNSDAFERFISRLMHVKGLMTLVKLAEIGCGVALLLNFSPGAALLFLAPIVSVIVLSHLLLNFRLGWAVALTAGGPFIALVVGLQG